MWRPSWSITPIGPLSLAASATTWLLVMTWPTLSNTNPEPVAPWALPLYSATICTVLGSIFADTAAMLVLSAASGGAVRRGTVRTPPEPPLSWLSETIAPATAPPTSPSSSASALTRGQVHPGSRVFSTGVVAAAGPGQPVAAGVVAG